MAGRGRGRGRGLRGNITTPLREPEPDTVARLVGNLRGNLGQLERACDHKSSW